MEVDAIQIIEMWLRQLLNEPPLDKYQGDLKLEEVTDGIWRLLDVSEEVAAAYGGDNILYVGVRPPKIKVEYHGLNYPPESYEYQMGDPELDRAIVDYIEMYFSDDEDLVI